MGAKKVNKPVKNEVDDLDELDDLAGLGNDDSYKNLDDDEDDFFGSSKKVSKKASAID
jgi:hypothetical protein